MEEIIVKDIENYNIKFINERFNYYSKKLLYWL